MSMPINYQYVVINTYIDNDETEESKLVFFETEQEARAYIKQHFEDSCITQAGYLIVPLDKCIAVYAETCASKFTDVGYEDVI